MKFSASLLLSTPILAYASAGLPTVVVQPEESPAGPLVRHATCQRDMTETTGFVTANDLVALSFTLNGALLTYIACKGINRYAGTEHPCTDISTIVAGALGIVFTYTGYFG